MGEAGKAAAIALSVVLLSARASADEPPEFRLTPLDGGSAVGITLVLEGEFRNIEISEPPVTNLRLTGSRRSSHEVRWTSDGMVRRRVLEWTATPLAPGVVAAGPLRLTLGRRTIVIPRSELRVDAQPRDERLRLEVHVSSENVDLGEQVYVTWTLVSREQLRDVRIIENASFEGFWVEEIPITGERDSMTWSGGDREYSLLLRRAVLYPLQTGALPIRPMHVEAEMLVPRNFGSPFSIFEGSFRTVGASAESILIRVGERHPRAQVSGHSTLQCGRPGVSTRGNVSWDVVVRSVGNLRLAEPPEFASSFAASTEAEDLGKVDVERTIGGVRMTRRWKMLIFPHREGPLEIPDLVFRYWEPSSASLREARCEGASLVIPARPDGFAPDSAPTGDARSDRRSTPLLIALALAAVAAIVIYLLRSGRKRPDGAHELIVLVNREHEPRRQREIVEDWLRGRGLDPYRLAWEESDAAERWRGVLSLLEVDERNVLSERDPAELGERITALVAAVRSRG